jgi:hypothetical protein
MGKSTIETCVYCGTQSLLTREHVIPQCLFLRPLPPTMVTVGICFPCNNNKSADDTYLRDWLLSDMATDKNAVVRELRAGKLMRSVMTNRSELAQTVAKQAFRKPLYTPAGIYVGSHFAAPLETKRLEFSFEKMVRGLYYHVWEQHLDRTYKFLINRIDMFHVAEVWEERKHLGVNLACIHSDVFFCQYEFDAEYNSLSRWLLLFYNSILIEVLTLPPNGIEALIRKDESKSGSDATLSDARTGTGASES